MQRSISRILTTHTGSLPRPADLVAMLNAKELGEPYDKAAFAARVQARHRRDRAPAGRHRHRRRRRRRAQQVQLDGLCAGAARRAQGDRQPGPLPRRDARLDRVRRRLRGPEDHACGALRRAGREAHRAAEGAGLRRADQIRRPGRAAGRHRQPQIGAQGRNAEEAFITAISPSNLELYYENQYYESDEEYLAALADAMRVEYLGDRRCRLRAADRRSPDGDALQPRGRGHDRGLPQIHRAAGRGAEPRVARHPGGQDPLPHLLQHQHRAARARLRAEALRRSHAAGPRRGLS